MKSSAKDILDRALEMPENDRAAIAERLLASLDAQPDRNVEEAWQQEIQRRLSETRSGRCRMRVVGRSEEPDGKEIGAACSFPSRSLPGARAGTGLVRGAGRRAG